MKLFVIGTDTEVGKTYVTTKLLKALPDSIGLKPVSSGKCWIQNSCVNRDAYLIQRAASKHLSIAQINPFSFEDPIAPHIAAEYSEKRICISTLVEHIKKIDKIISPKNLIIEGVGGLIVPYNENESQVNLLQKLNIPVLLVVGLKLGCLNHAALTLGALKSFNIPIKGWISNSIDPKMSHAQENILQLKKVFQHHPYWGHYPFKRVASPEE